MTSTKLIAIWLVLFAGLLSWNPLHAEEPPTLASFDIDAWADERVEAILARAEKPAPITNDSDVKTCCDVYGRCVVVQRHVMCPVGTW